jgi:hypothetical protein
MGPNERSFDFMQIKRLEDFLRTIRLILVNIFFHSRSRSVITADEMGHSLQSLIHIKRGWLASLRSTGRLVRPLNRWLIVNELYFTIFINRVKFIEWKWVKYVCRFNLKFHLYEFELNKKVWLKLTKIPPLRMGHSLKKFK